MDDMEARTAAFMAIWTADCIELTDEFEPEPLEVVTNGFWCMAFDWVIRIAAAARLAAAACTTDAGVGGADRGECDGDGGFC